MIRGSTTQVVFKLPYSYNYLQSVKVIFWQDQNIGTTDRPLPIIKNLAQCSQGSSNMELVVELNQEETLRFSEKEKMYMQLHGLTTDGNVFASMQKAENVLPIYDSTVLGDMVDPSPETLWNFPNRSNNTWILTVKPTSTTYPASEWTTTSTKNLHLGDICYFVDGDDTEAYYWEIVNNNYDWKQIIEKQDHLLFEGVYNASTNKVATRSFVEGAIAGHSVSGTPLIVSNINEMVNTERLYLLTSNQHIYYYYNNAWADSGVSYTGGTVVQSTGYSTTDVMSQSATTSMLAGKVDGAFVENGYLYLTSGDEVVAGPLGPFSGTGGGGGGGGGATYIVTLTNLLSDRIINTSSGGNVFINFSYQSIDDEEYPDGPGVGNIIVNGTTVKTITVPQGTNSINVKDYLSIGSNNVKIKVTNSEGSSRVLAYTVNVISLTVTTTFNDLGIYDGTVGFNYTVTGTGTKTVYLKMDGNTLGTETVTTSGRARTYNIAAQTNGAHYLTVYAETTTQDTTIRSNELNIGMIWKNSSMTNPAVLMNAGYTTATQGETLVFDYMVYNPLSEQSNIELVVIDEDGVEYSRTPITVDRTKHTWSISDYPYGDTVFKIVCGSATASKTIDVEEYVLPVSKVTENLELELNPSGRSNGEANPATWSYGTYTGTFSGFGWNEADGWLTDEDDTSVLRFIPGDTMTISIMPFASDIRETGYTIETEFSTHNVRDYDTVIVDCFNNGRGFEIKSQNTKFASEQSAISMQFKEDSKVRVTFSIEQRNQNRFINIYVNGVLCNVKRYPTNDNFAQQTPEAITLGATSCGLDLYKLRCYKKALTSREQLDNYIIDRPTLQERITAYAENDILGVDAEVKLDKLPNYLPVMVIESTALPTDKNADDITGAYVTFTDQQNTAYSFVATNASLAVQGTSSAGYPVKNFKVKMLKNGGTLTVNGTATTEGYHIKNGIAPIKTICLKADYASSEGANNVELVDLYNEICTWKTPAQLQNSEVRQGVAGRPIAVFWKNSTNNEVQFVGKYNMNWDKGNPAAYGFTSAYPNAESWEFLDNAVDLCLFKTANMTNWENAFEARWPDTKPAYSDTTRLSRVVSWVASTRRDTATNAALAQSVTYNGVTYTNDTSSYRLAKFKAEFEDYFVKSSAIFYYIFTETFLMVDSRAKNMFLTTYDGTHWGFLPYDFDTAIGM